MADLSDAAKGLIDTVAAILFSGTYLPGAEGTSILTWQAPVNGTVAACSTIQLYRGWPGTNDLQGDLVAGKAHVSVFPEGGSTQNTTRYQLAWRQAGVTASTLIATLSGVTITFSGTCSATQVVGILIRTGASAGSYAYRCTVTDTPATVAAAFAAAIPSASSSGAALTVVGDTISVNSACDQSATKEVRRQKQGFRISCWTPTPQARDLIAAAIDTALADMPWITLADGSAGRLIYRTTYPDDLPSKDRVWRRDLCYTLEYATLLSEAQPVLMFPVGSISRSAPVALTSAELAGLPTSPVGLANGTLWDDGGALAMVGANTTDLPTVPVVPSWCIWSNGGLLMTVPTVGNVLRGPPVSGVWAGQSMTLPSGIDTSNGGIIPAS